MNWITKQEISALKNWNNSNDPLMQMINAEIERISEYLISVEVLHLLNWITDDEKESLDKMIRSPDIENLCLAIEIINIKNQ